MGKHYKIFFLLFYLFIGQTLHAQDLPDDMPKIFYRNEKTAAIYLNSNGWGFGYRYGSRINYFEKKIFDIDFSILKHPKEIKSTSSFLTSESFIFGKVHSVFDLRFGYGKQNEIFAKRESGSVAIRYFYSFGPSIALQKPIYYNISYPLNDSVYTERKEKFDSDKHTSENIRGKASFFTGFDEMSVIPGAFIKTGFNFEFSQSENIIHSLEAGVIFQAYLKNLEIMAVDDNQQFLVALFLSYRFGKIVNAQDVSEDFYKRRKKKFKLF
ncbi:MAG TPA: hypothetical protein VJ896_01850 [Bacteroidales bacterium]|nr:hypothetical protein [Bacteroidales bacterium]